MSNLGDLQLLASSIATVTSPFRNYLNDFDRQYRSLNDRDFGLHLFNVAKPQHDFYTDYV